MRNAQIRGRNLLHPEKLTDACLPLAAGALLWCVDHVGKSVSPIILDSRRRIDHERLHCGLAASPVAPIRNLDTGDGARRYARASLRLPKVQVDRCTEDRGLRDHCPVEPGNPIARCCLCFTHFGIWICAAGKRKEGCDRERTQGPKTRFDSAPQRTVGTCDYASNTR